MNNIVISSVIFILLIIISRYEFSEVNVKQLSSYDFIFDDFSLYSTSISGTNFYLYSKSGKIKNNEAQFDSIAITKNDHTKNKNIEYLRAGHLTYENNHISLHNGASYSSDNILISSDNILYNIQTQMLTMQNSILKLGDNVLDIKSMSFNTQSKNFDAQKIKATFKIQQI